MKVSLQHCQQSFSGVCDDLVYYRTRRSGQLYARRYVRPRYTAANQLMGNNIRHLEALQPSALFINDLRQYISLYNARLRQDEKHLHNWHALYVRLMFAQAKAAGIPIQDITRELIQSAALPCRSVKTAVEEGLLSRVEGFERLDNEM